ncbi:MAG: HAD family hydrolase [Actinomycetales bacterium]
MTSPARWPHVLFDLDGTLVDTIALIVASYQHAVRTVTGRQPDEAEARAWIGRPLLPALLEVDPQRGAEMDAVYRTWNLANSERLIRPYPGIDSLLGTLREHGVSTGVATSKRRHSAELALRLVGLDGRIELLATMESTAVHKPDPRPLLYAVERLGAQPGACAYVGDAVVDVQAARAAGMTSIAVAWGAAGRQTLELADPDHLVEDVSQLKALLLGKDLAAPTSSVEPPGV